MKRFRCGDVVPNCTREFEAQDEQDLFSQIADHAAADHGITEISPQLQDAVRAQVVEV